MESDLVEVPETYSPLETPQADEVRSQIPPDMSNNDAIDVYIAAVNETD